MRIASSLFALGVFFAFSAQAQFVQHGNKLFGTGAVGGATQGWSVSLSSDGNTAIIGGNQDNSFAGAAWIWARSGGVWSQQGSKLVGTGAVGNTQQGYAVSLSSDGNTAIAGGINDNSSTGATWVWTRSGGVWSQQGNKLVGTGAVGAADQGISVSLSSDGNTAIIGGQYDNANAGAAWVWTRTGGVWTQQGSKIVGTGAVGGAYQGCAVSLSSDGNTAIVGGDADNGTAGAAWVWTRSGGVWTQQGSKLVGTGAAGSAAQGISVSLSSDGNAAIVGGSFDNTSVGAAWMYHIVPAAPQNLVITDSSSHSITLRWRKNIEPKFLMYRIYRGTSPNPVTEVDSSTGGNLSDTSKTFAGLVNNTRYYFRVTAVDSSFNESGYSNQVNAAPADRIGPAAPQNLVVTDSSNGSITIKWRKNTELDFLRYRIYRNTSPNPVTKVDSTTAGIADTAKTFSGLVLGTKYYFRVTAIDSSLNESGYSNEVNAALPLPLTVTSFSPTSGPIGTSVSISGLGFNATPAKNIVYLGAVRTLVTGGTGSSLSVSVPYGTTFAPISVTDSASGLTAFSNAPFIVTFPSSRNIISSSLAPKVDFTTGSAPFGIVLGDLDGDGRPDVVSGNSGSTTLSVLRNTSSSGSIIASSLGPKVDFTAGTAPYNIAIGDLDGDGKPDIVASNAGTSFVSVFRNTSSSGSITAGSFAAKVDFASGSGSQGVAIGDVDGDGKPDIVVANMLSTTLSVLRNTSTAGSLTAGSFAAKVDFATGASPQGLVVRDVDGDGKPDLIVSNVSGASVSVLRNTSTIGSITSGSFAAIVNFVTGAAPRSVAIGDLDGDGKPDLAVANYGTGLNTVSVLRNTSTPGSITSGSFATKVDFATGQGPYCVAIGDMDGDGKPDLVVANSSANTLSILRNTSSSGSITTSSFALKVDFTTGATPYFVAIGDVDGDGKPDVVAGASSSDAVSILRNTIGPPAGVKDLMDQVPKEYSLSQNYPNPFNPSTVIRYGLQERSTVKVQIFDVLGRTVATLVDGEQDARFYEVTWQANVSSGLYFYRIEAVAVNNSAKSYVQVKKMMLLK